MVDLRCRRDARQGTVAKWSHLSQNQAGAPAAPTGTGRSAADPKYARSMEAAYKTAQLANVLLQVTTDGELFGIPVGKHSTSHTRGSWRECNRCRCLQLARDVQEADRRCQKVLYRTRSKRRSIVGKSKLYQTYEKNARDYAMAKMNYAVMQAQAKGDRSKADIWPMTSVMYQNMVDDAYNTLKTIGREKVERAARHHLAPWASACKLTWLRRPGSYSTPTTSAWPECQRRILCVHLAPPHGATRRRISPGGSNSV